MDQASRLDSDARGWKALRDEPVRLGDHLMAWALVAFLALTFYWPVAMVAHVAFTALGIEWAAPGF